MTHEGQRTVASSTRPPRPTEAPAPPPPASGGYVNRFELAIRADLEVIKAQPSQDEESQ